MELRQLKYFVALAEELHFRRAAARLSMSQPPLSSAIKQVEEELGTRLFERNTKVVSLTPAGAAFYPEALKVLAQLEQACATTRDVGAGKRGQLRIGFVGGMLLRGIPEAVSRHDQEARNVTISLREMSSAEQLYAIAHGQLAAGFLHAGVLPADLDSLVIRSERFVACLPADHPCAAQPHLDLKQLSGEDMVLFARDASPSYYDSVVALCAAAGFSPRVRHEVTHWLTALVLVSRGAGVAVVPDAFVNAGLQGVRYVALRPSQTRSIAYLVWKRGGTDPALLEFVAYMQGWCRKPADALTDRRPATGARPGRPPRRRT
ncbi:LysR family transcriptional regulator [Aquabacterium sp. J223]|uniref:LysR family transcriptional regulator n=1 Tax=Aquabacterium sp. J223 TaxID=2898431 RepID=UPI0021AD7207|nr:LysR family transcriptional regulator [Aquabacterium sp. J223]UUX93992.1 LysR family transcriptional regulator [Aquabacterium sp. J223]